ncbi:NAD(P)-binding protein [Amniculicola lignicola CBS 123094]|uniref:NAD(P)-binding protein n=1 Tax=Amniculicola lignicola CBS 123094 TaxID=1392246 RepID=A0A6A5WX02_9PLEO|nr:NAD(P)-binding protein [Amniculicola lignicola CBS 123094]
MALSNLSSTVRSGRLSSTKVIVTGSSSGLGREIAKACSNRVTTGQPTHELLTQDYGGEHLYVRADLTNADEVEHVVAKCVEEFGRLDVMKAHSRVLRIHVTREADYDKTMVINTKAMFLRCKYAIAQMLKQEPLPDRNGDRGWIVNTARVQGFVGYFGTPSYAASKGAAVSLTRHTLQRSVSWLIKDAHVFGGMGEPEHVARAAMFLASDDAAWVTGVPLPVDGGFLCQ